FRDGERGRCDGRREAGEKGDPTGKESPARSPGLGEVDVFAAGAREVNPQLGIAQGSGEGEGGPDEPDRDDQGGRSQVPGEKARGGEDTGADHVRDDDRGGAKDT